MRWAAAAAGAAGLAVLLYLGWFYAPLSGAFSHHDDRLARECRKVDTFPGPEDVTIDPDLNLAFISADDRRATQRGAPVQGGVYAMSLDEAATVRRVGGDGFGPFHPHGFSLWKGADGVRRLFVINHRTATDSTLELFDVGADGSLTHARTIPFPAGSSPNDVVGVGPEAFYASNDHGAAAGLLRTLETYLALPFANVVYFDGARWTTVAKGLRFANGINRSPDGRDIYVSELYSRRVDVYRRDASNGALTRIRSWPVDFGADNIEVARDGGLWVAGHDNVFAFLAHARDAKKVSPSRVIRLNAETGDYATLFSDRTGVLNASSVGAVWDRTLIVGSVFDSHVMVCPLLEIFFRTAPAYNDAPSTKGGR